MLKKAFLSRDSEIWKKLYVSLARSYIDYIVQVWSLYLVIDIEALEKLKRWTSKIPDELCGLDYEERIK